jgi:hypothetical protein
MNNSAARRWPTPAGIEKLDPNSGVRARLMNGVWNRALVARIDEVAMRQHGGAAADCRTVHGDDDRLPEVEQGFGERDCGDSPGAADPSGSPRRRCRH